MQLKQTRKMDRKRELCPLMAEGQKRQRKKYVELHRRLTSDKLGEEVSAKRKIEKRKNPNSLTYRKGIQKEEDPDSSRPKVMGEKKKRKKLQNEKGEGRVQRGKSVKAVKKMKEQEKKAGGQKKKEKKRQCMKTFKKETMRKEIERVSARFPKRGRWAKKKTKLVHREHQKQSAEKGG